jgi:hypothetical protein
MEVQIPADDYAELFQQYEYPYEGGPLTEVAIPSTDVEQLNDYLRTWHR